MGFVGGRCRASKKCGYCGRLAAVENAEMVALDACVYPPTLFVVLTTRDPAITGREVRRGLEKATAAARRRWPRLEWACFVEFTTGLSVWSGGHRRIHLNLLAKGVPVEAADELRNVLLKVWGTRTNTTELHVGRIYAAEGLVRYVTNLALHVMKDGQRPPESYAGNLVRWTRGYFEDGATVMRDRARASLQEKRWRWKVERDLGVDGEGELGAQVVALGVELLRAQAAATSWELVKLRRAQGATVFEVEGVIA